MKKTAVIIALALGFSITTAYATISSETVTTNVSELTKSSVNPFCISIVKGDIETVKKLIELGTDVNEKSNGMTPVMYAAKFNRVDILKLLVENGAKLNLKSEKGYTAEKYAQLSNATEALTYLKSLS
uniref:ankyrin repeat domain-containing protein n=1 Tax=Gelidibacter sp. TaxID=2018083 RepID=UPI00404B6400